MVIAFERDPVNLILVDPNARVTHPLIRDAATALKEARPSYEDIRHTPRGCIDIRVSKESISRALKISQIIRPERPMRVARESGASFAAVPRA